MKKLDIRSALLGAAFVIVAGLMLGATARRPLIEEIGSLRFLVLEVTPKGEPTDAEQTMVLKVSRHYGKIDRTGLDFKFANETQELKLLVSADKGYAIKRGDILDFRVTDHLKLSPGSSVTRHFPSGTSENVTAATE